MNKVNDRPANPSNPDPVNPRPNPAVEEDGNASTNPDQD